MLKKSIKLCLNSREFTILLAIKLAIKFFFNVTIDINNIVETRSLSTDKLFAGSVVSFVISERYKTEFRYKVHSSNGTVRQEPINKFLL